MDGVETCNGSEQQQQKKGGEGGMDKKYINNERKKRGCGRYSAIHKTWKVGRINGGGRLTSPCLVQPFGKIDA